MTLPGNPTYRPGNSVSASELQRTSDLADRNERGGTAGIGHSQNDGGGLQVAVPPPAEWWIKITAQNSSSPQYFYSWVSLRRAIDNLDWEVDDQGPAGFFDSIPAIEINEDESVPNDYVAKAWLGDDGQSIYFAFTASGGGGGDGITNNYNNSNINLTGTSNLTLSSGSTFTNNGKTIIAGPLYQPFGTAISLTGDIDDLSLPDGAVRVRIFADEDYWRINSINPGTSPAGRVLCLHNVGTKVILLGHLSAGTVGYRINTTTLNDYFLGPDGEVTLVYDGTSGFWRVSENYEERLGGYVTVADWGASVNNWNPAKRYHVQRVNPTAADIHVTGIAGGAPNLQYRVVNVNSVNGFWFDHNSLSSDDENRMLLPNGEDVWVAPRSICVVEWDGVSLKWRMHHIPQAVSGPTLAEGRIGYGSVTNELTGTLDLYRESEAVFRVRGSTGSAQPIIRIQRNIEGVDLSNGDVVGQRIFEPLYDASYVPCFQETIKHWETVATDKTVWEIKVGSGDVNNSAIKAGTNGRVTISQASATNKLVGTGATHGELINISLPSPYLILSGGNLIAINDLLSPLHDTEVVFSSDGIALAARMNVLDGTGCTLSLPTASGPGRLLGIRVEPAATGLFIIDANGTDLIDGEASQIMWAGESAILICDGVSWHKIAGKTIPMKCKISNGKAVGAFDPINHATVTVVPMDVTYIDNTGLMADLANDRITCRRTNDYITMGFVAYHGDASAGGLGANATRLFASFPGAQPEISSVAGSVPAVGAGTLTTLTAGSTYQLSGYQTTGLTQYFGSGTSSLAVVEVPKW